MSKHDVELTKPVAPWLGGKRNLAKRICAIIDADPHLTYAEPFVGMGGIFLRRRKQARAEFINDAQQDVYNLFRVLQEHYVAFLDLMRFQLTTQANFIRLVYTDPSTLAAMHRAARFLYLQPTAFGGKVSGRNFGLAPDRPARFNLTTLEAELEALHTRLSGVTVTCMDYADFIRRIDRPGAFFYLDPPYWGCENDYGKNLFERADFERLAAQLKDVGGTFLMSINDVPEIREIFSAFRITPVETTYTIGKTNDARGSRAELLISNFWWGE